MSRERTSAAARGIGAASIGALALVGAFLAAAAASADVGGPSARELVAYGARVDALVADGGWYRLVTAVFLHVDAVHLVTNAVWVALLLGVAAALLGGPRALGVAVWAGALGHLASFAAGAGASVGASGAVYGLAALVGVAAWRRRRALDPEIRWRALASLAAATVVLLVAPVALDGVDHAAHLGGFAAGLALGALPDTRSVGGATCVTAIALVAAAWTAFAVAGPA